LITRRDFLPLSSRRRTFNLLLRFFLLRPSRQPPFAPFMNRPIFSGVITFLQIEGFSLLTKGHLWAPPSSKVGAFYHSSISFLLPRYQAEVPFFPQSICLSCSFFSFLYPPYRQLFFPPPKVLTITFFFPRLFRNSICTLSHCFSSSARILKALVFLYLRQVPPHSPSPLATVKMVHFP